MASINLLDVLRWFDVSLCATGLTMMKMDNVITNYWTAFLFLILLPDNFHDN